MRLLFHSSFLLFIILVAGCQSDATQQTKATRFEVKAHVPNEPDNLHPMFSRSSFATPIENLILIPLAEIDPYENELTPLLIEEVPTAELVTEGPFKDLQKFDIRIRPEATWEDGRPVTAEDYLFTLKAAFVPNVNSPTWKRALSAIKAVNISDPAGKNFTVMAEGDAVLGVLSVVNFNIFPKHIYDAQGRLDNFSLSQLQDTDGAKELATTDANLDAFGNEFQDVKFQRQVVTGAGPYAFDQWATGEEIRLKKKENYWADQLTDVPRLLKANPETITFRIIADENTAIAAMKDGQLDVISELSPDAFVQLRDDAKSEGKFNFYTPAVMYYNFLALNNRDEKLKEVNVRKALARCLDVDALIENVALGLAARTVGPVHPSKAYYNDDLKPIEQDMAAAKKLLSEAGWEDTNNDGTVDKVMDGEKTELELEILVSSKRQGQQIALILQQYAAEVGIDIQIVTKEGAQLLADIRSREYDMAPMRLASHPLIYDPHQSWHSESDRPGGGNRSGYHDEVADDLMDALKSEKDEKKQNELYRKLQAEIYEDEPVIFLYTPSSRIVTSNRLDVTPSTRRPGYFINLFERSQ